MFDFITKFEEAQALSTSVLLNHLRANFDFQQTSDTISYISFKYQRIF